MGWSGRAQRPIVGADGLGSIEPEGANDAIPYKVDYRYHCNRDRYR